MTELRLAGALYIMTLQRLPSADHQPRHVAAERQIEHRRRVCADSSRYDSVRHTDHTNAGCTATVQAVMTIPGENQPLLVTCRAEDQGSAHSVLC